MIRWVFLILLVGCVIIFRKVLFPLFAGIALAYVLNPFVTWLQNRLHLHRNMAILTAYLLLFAFFFFIIFAFSNLIRVNLANGTFDESANLIKGYLSKYQNEIQWLLPDLQTPPPLSDILIHLGRLAVHVFLSIIISFYLLKDIHYFLRLIRQGLHLFLGQRVHGHIRELAFDISGIISAFMRGVFIDSVIVSFLASAVLTALKLNYSILIGCFAGITNIIPYFGPFIGMLPAVFVALSESGPMQALFAAGALFLIQQLESNYIYPHIVGKSTGLHPVFILLAVSIAGYYGGLISMVLAVPAAGIIKLMISKWAEQQ